MVHGPKEKKERSLGERLHLKGERCDSPKCAIVRKPARPGMHGMKRKRAASDFARQLNEKQKFKVSYGLNENNLRRLFSIADQSQEGTSKKLVELMERRLDNVVFRLGLAPSRGAARQSVIHGHVEVNGTRVRSPGFLVNVGDAVGIREGSRALSRFQTRQEALKEYTPPSWLTLKKEVFEGKMTAPPTTEDIPFEANLVVESFSK